MLAVLLILHSLDQPWLKLRVQAIARTSAGIDLDYRAIRVGLLSGVEVDELVVRSPAELRPLAPDLLRVGHLEARWSPGSLLGHGPAIERLTISDVALTVVVDEHGRTSFDALSQPGAKAPSAPVPLSRQAAILRTAPPVGQIEVGHVTLALVRTEQGLVSERTNLGGIAAATSAQPIGKEGWRVAAGIGTPSAPLELVLTRERGGAPAGRARARFWLTLDATSTALTAALDLNVPEQTFVPSASVEKSVHAEASVRFDPAAGRTEITLHHTEAGDGAATAEASVEMPDQGDAVVRHAEGDIDVARLLQWVPAGLVPVTAERARIRYQVDALVVGPVLRLAQGAAVVLDADLASVKVDLGDGPLEVGGVKLALHAQPAEGGGIAGRGTLQLTGTRLESGGDRVAVEGVVVDLDGEQRADGAIAGRAGVRFARFARGGGSPIVADEGLLDLRVKDLYPDADVPLATRGDISLALDLASLDLRSAAARVIVDGLKLHAHTLLAGHAPYAVELEAAAARLRVLGRQGAPLVDAPARIEGALHDAFLNLARPASSRGVARVTVDLAEMKASVDTTKGDDAVDLALQVTAPSLKRIRPFLTAALANEAPWDQIGVALRTRAHVAGFASTPSIEQSTEIDLERPAFDNVVARSLSLTLHSKGTALQHEADVDLRAQALAIDGGKPSDDHAALSASLDRQHPSFRLRLDAEGRAAVKLSASVSFDSSRRAVPYEIDGHFAGLSALSPILAKVHGLEGLDLSQLELGLSARGDLLGVVTSVGRDGAVEIAPHPSRTAGVEGSIDLNVAHLHWAHGDNAIITPALSWHAALHVAGTRRTVDNHLEAGALHLDLGAHDVDLTGIRHESSATMTGDLLDPETTLTQRTTIRTVVQDYVPEYPIGDFAFALSAERAPNGLVHVSDLKLANGAGGTTLGLTGNLEFGDGRRTLSMTTMLGQDLARLTGIPERFAGRGTLGLEANVTSPDLALFRVRAALKATDVFAAMPHDHIEIEAANGEVPITVTLEAGKNGVALRRDEKHSPYSMLRFADQHPLLSRSGFLSIASIKTPFVAIAPLVGNLEIEENVFSLRQFEMGVRGGTITGQCGLDWDGPRSTLELHVRASGVQSSHGEPFDGNIAVAISAADRNVEGRAEILRIGERHLLDLLDLQDPLHVDPAMNRIRSALAFGYPDNLRLVFDHGFASAHLQLGGLARLISIGELRGIPMGPIIDQLLGPMLEGTDTKETP